MSCITENHRIGDTVTFPVQGWQRGRIGPVRKYTGVIEQIHHDGFGCYSATVKVLHHGLYHVDILWPSEGTDNRF